MTRRHALRLLGAGAVGTALSRFGPGLVLPTPVGAVSTTAVGQRRRRVGIVGGGIGGVAAAWLLDGEWDVVLFESGAALGGHAQTIEVDYRGRQLAVDVGAQFFAPGSHPIYSQLLELLGLFDPVSPELSPTVSVPLSLTMTEAGRSDPRFVSPLLPDRVFPLTEPWNLAALGTFATFVQAARQFDHDQGDWSITVEDWVGGLAIDQEQKDRVVHPLLAALNNQDVERSKALSARAAIYFLSRVLTDDLLAGLTYYNSLIGLGGIVQVLAAGCKTLTVHTASRVTRLKRAGRGYRITAENGVQEAVDVVIVAAPPYVAAPLMASLGGGKRVSRVLTQFSYFPATIQIHTDPAYMHPERRLWSFENIDTQGGFAESSFWFGSIYDPLPDGSTVDVFKSWTRARARPPQEVIFTQGFLHPLITPDFIQAQAALDRFQGRRNVWFVGSHCLEVDGQETALRSAMRVADVLAPNSTHYAALKEKLAVASSPTP